MSKKLPIRKANWFNRPGYPQGVFWIIMVALISSANDVFMRLTGTRLPSMQISFFRFFFAFLILLPIMIAQGKDSFRTSRMGLHIVRGFLGFGAIAFWCAGVAIVPLAIVSTLALTVPLFVLPMAIVFLGEHVKWQRVAATLFGFLGIAIVVNGTSQTQDALYSIQSFDKGTLFLIAATILFACSDILNKKMVIKESNLTMLFYFALGTTLCGVLPAYAVWQTPTFTEIFYLFCLGGGGNLILYCLLKAFAATEVSALAPYRYVELFFACFFGLILFGEIPSITTILGCLIIIPSTFAIAYYETKNQKRAQEMVQVIAS
jgi:S-adenosylmethionine uptake transporter